MAPANASGANRAFLFALTPEARTALNGAEAELKEFPFRVGRESRRFESLENKLKFSEKRKPTNLPNNDLYLLENAELMNVSREHFQIAREGGGFVLQDRGSTLGTIVEGVRIGGEQKGGRVALRDGDVIIIGASVSEFAFKFRVR